MKNKTTKKSITIVRNLLLLFIFFAVCGWIYEVLWTYLVDGVWTNRGYLFGPWLPIYGFGGMLVYGFFYKQLKKPFYIGKVNIRFLILFVYICLITTVLELAATYIIELFGTEFTALWDYSDRFLNFQGRICFDASARFGILGVMILYGALPLYKKLINLKNQRLVDVVAWTTVVMVAVDWISRIWLGNNYTGPI